MTGADSAPELRLVIDHREMGSDDVVVIELRHPASTVLPQWEPGAHIDVVLPDGVVRQYSLCGDPTDRAVFRIAVLREGVGSHYIHEHLRVGDELLIRGPRNHFRLEPAADGYIFIAGGIGITPILSMLVDANAAGAKWELHYGGRNRRSMAFLDEVIERSPGRNVTVYPQDEVGLIDLDTVLGSPRTGVLIYCCGPEPLLRAVEERGANWPAAAVHIERFQAKPTTADETNDSFEVELVRSGVTLTVPADTSLLDVLLDAGVDVAYSCQDGTCGTCETVVLDGEVDHRDSIMTPAEQQVNDTMYVCVSRAKCGKLLLDA